VTLQEAMRRRLLLLALAGPASVVAGYVVDTSVCRLASDSLFTTLEWSVATALVSAAAWSTALATFGVMVGLTAGQPRLSVLGVYSGVIGGMACGALFLVADEGAYAITFFGYFPLYGALLLKVDGQESPWRRGLAAGAAGVCAMFLFVMPVGLLLDELMLPGGDFLGMGVVLVGAYIGAFSLFGAAPRVAFRLRAAGE